jgi:hypothetical protein
VLYLPSTGCRFYSTQQQQNVENFNIDYIIELALVLNTADYLQNIFVHNCIGHFSMQ